MLIGQALDLVSRYDSLRNPLTSLGDYLAPKLISRCLAESGTVTLRKRHANNTPDHHFEGKTALA